MRVIQNYGVLRVVSGNHGSREKIARVGSSIRENSPDQAFGQIPPLLASQKRAKLRHKFLGRWLPEERLAHILSQPETTIGRALSSDIILLDPTVSRDHARLVLGEHGWCVQNVTENNVVRVNSHVVDSGSCYPVMPQDLLVIGNTTLQLVAPLPDGESFARMDGAFFQEEGQRQALSLGSGVTMQFALSRLGSRPRRFFILGGLVSLVIITGILLVLSSLNNLFGLTQYGGYSLVLALVVPLIPALGINILVNFIDRYEREPWFLRLAAFLWGAIIAIPPALFIEGFIDGFVTRLWGLDSQVILHAFLSGLDAGITEETVKGLGLLLLFFVLRDEFDNITDGIVYGALIGAGFAMVENFYYFLRNPNDLSVLIIGRVVLGWLSHSTFTICFGIALGYTRHTRVRWRHIVVPLLGYLLAVGLHTIFDFIEIFVRDVVPTYGNSPTAARFAIFAVVGNYISLFLVQIGILYILIKSLMHEAAIIREFLPSEVAEGVVTIDEYAMLPHSFARTRLERRVLWHYGIRQWLLTRALYQTEIGLAFRKWHVSMLQYPATDRESEKSLKPFFTPSAGNSNGTTSDMSSSSHRAGPDGRAASDGLASDHLQREVAYRKRIKQIREEIAALEAKRTQ